MKIAIVGAGKLGRRLAELLSEGDNDVTLIDTNKQRLDLAASQLDILTILGDAKETETLRSFNVGSYDFLAAVTDLDEKNMVICAFAKKLGCRRVIARVREPEHVTQVDFIRDLMKIDHIVNPDYSTATEIFKYLTEKHSLSDGIFNTGKISLVEFSASKIPEMINKCVKDTVDILSNILIISISRNGKIIVPNGMTVIEEGDTLFVIGEKDLLEKLNDRVREDRKESDVRHVMLAGGGKTGFFLAQMLAGVGITVKIIENDMARCTYLSERLPDDVKVLFGDATDHELLKEEHIEDMDAFVSLTGFDEENLLLALLASNYKVEDVVAKFSRNAYSDLIEQLGVSMALNPLDMTASSILRYIQGPSKVLHSKVIQGQAEFMEIIPDENTALINTPISKLGLPQGILIAAVDRDGKVIIPNGDTKILAGDRVIIICMLNKISALEKLIKGSRSSVLSSFAKFLRQSSGDRGSK